MGYRIGGDSGPGRNGRRPGEPRPFWPGSTPSALGLVPTPPANGGHSVPGGGGGDTRPANISLTRPPGPDNGEHRGMGMTFEEDKKRDRLTAAGVFPVISPYSLLNHLSVLVNVSKILLLIVVSACSARHHMRLLTWLT